MKSKKKLVASLAMAISLGVAGTAFAAAGNPFSDVPAKHWAYSAVSSLAKAGLVDGANGTFSGDKAITRYEMAQIVAKAMSKSDKADAQTKATIEKLQAEFANELQGLNVRVTNLENNADKVKFSGSVRERYERVANSPNLSNQKDNPFYETRLRLGITAPVGDGFTFKGRIQAKDEMGYGWYNSSATKKTTTPWDKSTGSTIMVDQAYLTGNTDGVDLTFGRFPLTVGYGLAFDCGSNNDGIKIGFGNEVKVNAGLMKDWGYTFTFGDVSYNLSKDLGFKAGYLKDNNTTNDYKTVTYGLSYAMSDFTLSGEYGVNKAKDAKAATLDGGNAKASLARIQYLSQDSSKKGSYDLWAGYRKADHGFDLFYWATPDAPANLKNGGMDNIKGWEVGADFTLLKNTTLSLNYADMKSNDGLDTSKKFAIAQISYSF